MTQTSPQPIPRPTPQPARQRFTARSSVDLVALTPHVLGFHPDSSVVLLTFRNSGSGVSSATSRSASFSARVDLPLDRDQWPEVSSRLVAAAEQHAVTAAAVLIYSDDHEVARGQAEVLVCDLRDAGVEVLDTLRVDEERWYAVLDDDLDGVAYDLSTHPLTAQQVFAGRQVQPSRAAIADSLVGGDAERLDRVEAAAGTVHRASDEAGRLDEARWLLGVLDRHRQGSAPSDDEVARLLVAITDFRLRDVLWLTIDRASAEQQVEFWLDVVRRTPTALLPDAAALLAFSAWLAGQGALAWCAVDRCGEVDPDHTLGGLVAQALMRAMSPDVWPVARLGLECDPEVVERTLVETVRGQVSASPPERR